MKIPILTKHISIKITYKNPADFNILLVLLNSHLLGQTEGPFGIQMALLVKYGVIGAQPWHCMA